MSLAGRYWRAANTSSWAEIKRLTQLAAVCLHPFLSDSSQLQSQNFTWNAHKTVCTPTWMYLCQWWTVNKSNYSNTAFHLCAVSQTGHITKNTDRILTDIGGETQKRKPDLRSAEHDGGSVLVQWPSYWSGFDLRHHEDIIHTCSDALIESQILKLTDPKHS